MDNTNQEMITRIGNPKKPRGDEGRQMLERMNESHGDVTMWALGKLSFNSDDSVLDIGCGGGATLKRISRHITTGHIAGVDYSPVSVELSRELNADDIDSGKTEVIEASVESLPFGDDSFDKIVTVESFYFWPDPPENLKEVLRVLKPGGTFIIVADVYNKDGLKEKTLENIRRYEMFNPTPGEFEDMFKSAGFASVKIHTEPETDWICVEGIK